MLSNNKTIFDNNVEHTQKSNTVTVAMNLGYGNTKLMFDNEKIIFNSTVSSYIDEPYNETILLDGTRYVIGKGINKLDLDKSTTLHQKILVLYSLSKIPYQFKRVICAMPCNTYINRDVRNKYKDFMLSFDNVKEVIVYPEGASVQFNNFDLFANKLVLVIDIGFYTINFIIFSNNTVVKSSMFSKDLGYYILQTRIEKTIEQSSLSNIPDYQVQFMMNNPIVKPVIDSYIDEIKLQMQKHQYPTEFDVIYCTGGGCLNLQDQLKQSFNNVIIDNDCLFGNCKGLLNIGRRIWNE